MHDQVEDLSQWFQNPGQVGERETEKAKTALRLAVAEAGTALGSVYQSLHSTSAVPLTLCQLKLQQPRPVWCKWALFLGQTESGGQRAHCLGFKIFLAGLYFQFLEISNSALKMHQKIIKADGSWHRFGPPKIHCRRWIRNESVDLEAEDNFIVFIICGFYFPSQLMASFECIRQSIHAFFFFFCPDFKFQVSPSPLLHHNTCNILKVLQVQSRRKTILTLAIPKHNQNTEKEPSHLPSYQPLQGLHTELNPESIHENLSSGGLFGSRLPLTYHCPLSFLLLHISPPSQCPGPVFEGWWYSPPPPASQVLLQKQQWRFLQCTHSFVLLI